MHSLFRPLTPPEATFAYMHRLLDGNTQVASVVSLPFLADEARLQAAVARLPALFWCLSVQIVERDDYLWFYPSNNAPLVHTSVNVPGTTFSANDALRNELRDVLPPDGPLWRFRAVFDLHEGHTHILFSRNHAVSDGYTSAIVLSTLLELLDDGPGPEPELPLLLSAWKALPSSAALLATSSRAVTPYEFPEPTERSRRLPGLASLHLPSGAVRMLRAAGQANECSVNDLFAAALLRGFCRATSNDNMVLFTAASLRSRSTGGPVESTGCFVTVVPTLMDAGRDGLLPLARRYRGALQSALEAWRPPENDHRAIRAGVERNAGTSTYPGIAFTNVGTLPARAKALLSACEYRTVVNRSAGNYGIVLHLSSLGDDFAASLAYPCGLLPEPIVAKVKSHIEKDIAALHSL